MTKKYKSNAEKQRAYRERKKQRQRELTLREKNELRDLQLKRVAGNLERFELERLTEATYKLRKYK